MKTLLILSDLWGWETAPWLTSYTNILQDHYKIECFDSRELANMMDHESDEYSLHAAFVSGGIEYAATQLMERVRHPIDILAFSIGGVIAWKACLLGLLVQNLFAVSSTRLRYEAKKPLANTMLFFGGLDNHVPDVGWMKAMNVPCKIINNEQHNMYRKNNIAEDICTEIVGKVSG